jgi:tripartite ATP-independent transporter DctM subunit
MIGLEAGLAALTLILLIILEFPIAYAFATATIVLAVMAGRDLALILPTAFWQTGGFALLALPLFIIAGIVMRDSRISDYLVASVERVLGGIKGSLGAVTVGSCMLFGAISGSGAAAIAAIGAVMVPKMTAAGYDRGYATALVACSSVLALLIPPSIPMIVFALTAGLPVSACFLSTVGPGIVIGIIYMAMNRRTTMRLGIDQVRPTSVDGSRGESLRALPALFMPVLMLGGIYSGAFTPTEAAAVALVYGVLVGLLVYRSLGLGDVARCFVEGGAVCASVIAILLFLLVFGKLLALEQIPGHIANGLLSLFDNYYAVLLIINIVLLIIGMFLDDISGSILAAVILLPVAKQVGVDPIHFAAIVGTNLGLGNVTPPCAPLLFVAGSVTGLDLHAFLRPALRFMLLGHLPVVLLVTYVPALGTLLPDLLL